MNNIKTTIFNSLIAVLTLFLVSSSVFAQQVSLDFGGDLAGRTGDAFTLEVSADLGDNEVDNFDFEFEYDTSLVEVYVDSIEAGALVTGTFLANEPEDGRIKLATYNNSPDITGSSVLFTIKGKFKASGINGSGIQFTGINIGNNLSTNATTPVEVKTTSSEKVFQLPNINGANGESLEAAITVDNLDSLNIASYQFKFAYDTSVVSIDGVNTTGTASASDQASINTVNGVANVAWAGSSNLTGVTTLLNLEVTLLASAENSRLEFTNVQFFDDNGDEVAIAGINGSVSVSDNAAPSFTSVLPDTTVDEGTTLEFTYVAEDADEDELTYSLGEVTPEGATIDAETGAFSFELGFNTAGEHTIVVNVTDGIATATDTATITVNNVVAEVTIAEAREMENGSEVSITGIITTPDYGFNNGQFFVQDETAGINVFYSGVGGGNTDTPFESGMEITITGETGSFSNQAQISPSSYEIQSEGNMLPDPVLITSLDEWTADSPYQGMRVTLENMHLPESSPWPEESINSSSGLTTYIVGNLEQTADTFDVRIDRGESFFDGSARPEGNFNFSGVMAQFNDDTQLQPFFENELNVATSIPLVETPSDFALKQNYPNPFNPTTVIPYAIPEATQVTITVHNVLGQKVATLVNQRVSAGTHSVTFDAANFTSGVYFARITAGNFTSTKKMLLLK